MIDSKPTAEHVRYLCDAGATLAWVSRQSGISYRRVQYFSNPKCRTVEEHEANAVMAVKIPDGPVRHKLKACTPEERRYRFFRDQQWEKAREDRLAGNPHVIPVGPTRDWIDHLVNDFGMSMNDIGEASGVSHKTVYHVYKKARTNVYSWVSEAIMAVDKPIYTKLGLQRRLRALTADGFNNETVAREFDMTPGSVVAIRRGRGEHTTLFRQIIEGYSRLAGADPLKYGMTVGGVSSCKTKAKKMAYVPSIYWDEDTIDDSNAFPDWTGGCGTKAGYTLHMNNDVRVIEWTPGGTRIREYAICRACREYGRTRDRETLSRAERGLPPLTRAKLDPERTVEALAMLGSGMSQRQVAVKFDVSQQVIWRLAKVNREKEQQSA